MTTLKPIEYNVETIDYNEAFNAKPEAEDSSSMSYAERLALEVEQADAKTTMNMMHKQFDWSSNIYAK